MNITKSILLRFIVIGKNLKYSTFKPKRSKFIHQNVPYYSQWESSELVDKIISGEIKAGVDPKWRKSGAKNKLEYTHWSWSGCGISCFQMIYAHMTNKKIPLVILGKKIMKYGGYRLNKSAFDKGDYIHSLPGLFYKPFLVFLKNEYGLRGKILSPMVLREIIWELEKGNYIMASVNGIRNPNVRNNYKGGHLVLVLGYDLKKNSIYLHNPSGRLGFQRYVEYNFKDFRKFFGSRGIVLESSRTKAI